MNQIGFNSFSLLLHCFLPQPALNVPEPVREKLDSEESESVVSEQNTKRQKVLNLQACFPFPAGCG